MAIEKSVQHQTKLENAEGGDTCKLIPFNVRWPGMPENRFHEHGRRARVIDLRSGRRLWRQSLWGRILGRKHGYLDLRAFDPVAIVGKGACPGSRPASVR